jgi:hypothetical protein
VSLALGCADSAGQVLGLPVVGCARGRRGSGVKGRPEGRSRQRCVAPLRLEGRPRTLRRTPRARTPQPGVSGRGGGGVPERGRGFRHCQAHIRVSSSQVGCSQDGAPHLRRASVGSKHSRGSFLPRRASRYTTGLGRARMRPRGLVSWSSPPTRSRPARGRWPPPPPPVACRARSSSCTWHAAAAGPSTTWRESLGWSRLGGARG